MAMGQSGTALIVAFIFVLATVQNVFFPQI
jgi:hypothetical protein